LSVVYVQFFLAFTFYWFFVSFRAVFRHNKERLEIMVDVVFENVVK